MNRPEYIQGPASFRLYGSEGEPTVNVGAGTKVKLFTADEFSKYYEHVELPWRRKMNQARVALRGEKEE